MEDGEDLVGVPQPGDIVADKYRVERILGVGQPADDSIGLVGEKEKPELAEQVGPAIWQALPDNNERASEK